MPKVSNFKFDQVDNNLMHFIAEKSRNVTSPLNITQICKEFIEFSGSSCSPTTFQQRFYKNRLKIHKMDNFDIETKVKMLFATSTPVDFNFLNELKKEATVEVDHQDRITSYIANDGSVKLEGDHSFSSKRRRCHAERIESTSSDEFLKLLQNVVKTLGSEMLHDVGKDIGRVMKTLKNENRKVPIKDVALALHTALTMIIKAAKPKGTSSENTESLKGFLMILNIFALNNSSLTVIQQEIQEAIQGLSDEDKTISIKNIRIVLESMLLFVT